METTNGITTTDDGNSSSPAKDAITSVDPADQTGESDGTAGKNNETSAPQDTVKEVKETDSSGEVNVGDSDEKENEIKGLAESDNDKEFKVDLNLDTNGEPTPRYCRVNTVLQIRQKPIPSDKPLNFSYPDLRRTNEGPVSVKHVTSALFLANRKAHRVAAVVAQPRVQFLTEDHGFETPVKQDVLMAECGDDVSSAGSTSAVVVTTAPVSMMEEGEEEDEAGKPPLQRRMSLNPRMMTPPGLEILKNKAVVIVRQQMDADLLGMVYISCCQ